MHDEGHEKVECEQTQVATHCGAVVLREEVVHVALDDGGLAGADLADDEHFVELLDVLAACAVRVAHWTRLLRGE